MTETIRVGLKNHVDLFVDADDPAALYHIREAFTFMAPKYKFHPKYKAGLWDGSIKIFKINDRTMPAGLFEELKAFIDRDPDYRLELLENGHYGLPGAKSVVDMRELWDFVQERQLHAEGKPIEVYDYQFAAVYDALVNRRRILKSPTATGKSLMMYLLVRWWLAHEGQDPTKRFLIIVPNTGLVDQLMGDFEEYAQVEGWPVDSYCHKIYAGQDKTARHQVFITTWQSLKNFPKGFFKDVRAFIGDEAHEYAADVVQGLMRECADAPYRWGTTGTLNDSKIGQMNLIGAFGPITVVTTTREQMDKGRLSQMTIDLIRLKYPAHERKGFKHTYDDEVKFIETHQGRMDFLIKLCQSLEGNIVILFRHQDHGKAIYEALKSTPGAPWTDLFYIDGTVPTEDRTRYRKAMNKSNRGILVGSFQTCATGMNIRKLHYMVMAAPHKGLVKILQALGRLLRLSPDGRPAKVFDLVDDISPGKRANHALRHGNIRLGIYESEEFDYTVYDVNLEIGHEGR